MLLKRKILSTNLKDNYSFIYRTQKYTFQFILTHILIVIKHHYSQLLLGDKLKDICYTKGIIA